MEELVSFIVKKIVKCPDEVDVTVKEDGKVSIINVKANKEDIGRIIGKNGRIIGSIRAIVKSISSKSEKRFVVKVGE